jgi:hypothetical protein
MRNATREARHLIVPALLLALLAVSPLAAQTATVNLTGASMPGVTPGIVWGSSYGIYTSPYSGNINGGSTIPLICDDFADNSYLPESWTAYATQLSSLTSSATVNNAEPASADDTNLRWTTGDNSTLTQNQAYAAAAYLAVQIDSPANVANPGSTAAEELSFAMWALFDPVGTSGDPGAELWLTSNGYTTSSPFYQQVIADLNNAVTFVKTASASQVQADINAITIYSYDPSTLANPNGPTCGGGPCPSSPPQEFIAVNMAEPSSPALLGFDLLSVAGLAFLVRRRFAGSAN